MRGSLGGKILCVSLILLLLLVEPDADDVANDVADEDVNDVDDDALIDDPETATLAEAANTCSLMRGTGSACGGGETGSSSSFINVEVPAKMANQSITHFLASVCKDSFFDAAATVYLR